MQVLCFVSSSKDFNNTDFLLQGYDTLFFSLKYCTCDSYFIFLKGSDSEHFDVMQLRVVNVAHSVFFFKLFSLWIRQ